tara:strand:+ start:2107 stop:2310 length:204 start_codon:yes stop_codon:yes gene_type:complete
MSDEMKQWKVGQLHSEEDLTALKNRLNTHDPHDMYNWEDETSVLSKVLFGTGFSISLFFLVYVWLIQ